LFARAGADGAVEFFDYFETRVSSLEKNWWWPLKYWTVATISDTDPDTIQPPSHTTHAYFYGGWQFPQ
jgi:hypothetical protein